MSTCSIAASVRADDGLGGRETSGSSSVFTGPLDRSYTATLPCAMTRRVPARAAAASRLSVPRVRSSLVAANTWSTLRRLRKSASAVIWCTITSGPAASTAAITASRSSPSTTTGSAPASRSRATLPGVLVVAVTSVTRRDQPRNEVPSQCPGRSRDEALHDLSFRVVPSLEDKAPPGAVTFFNAP